ncbi:rhodanese domain-containing protein CG4456-like [Apostichopus japonicus]|uniref:rhodanese domain-containing protein CG4456-like n=1 Tax=Stichopus japonicus TaxID=307972 RepID=UPI003AB4E113
MAFRCQVRSLQRTMKLLTTQYTTAMACRKPCPTSTCSYVTTYHRHYHHQPLQVSSTAIFSNILSGSGKDYLPKREISSTHEGSESWKDVHFSEMEELSNRSDTLIVDVRERSELEKTCQIGASVNIPLGDLYSAFSLPADDFKDRYKVEKPETDDSKVVLHCLGGIRSKTGLDILKTLGYNKFRHFPGGWEEWSEKKELPS